MASAVRNQKVISVGTQLTNSFISSQGLSSHGKLPPMVKAGLSIPTNLT